MGTTFSCALDNDDLVDILIVSGYIRSREVERVLREVDRGDYVLSSHRHLAYKDLSWKMGNIHLSAPCIYCKVMEGLSLQPGLSFLNIGSGTGYLSTMAGLMLGENGINHGIEMHDDTVAYAYERLEAFKEKSLYVDNFDFCEPTFKLGNFFNVIPNRRYDRVYCGASCPEIHEKFVKQFVRVGGILVMPYKDHLLRIERVSETSWRSRTMLPVSFATLAASKEENGRVLLNLPLCQPISLQELCRGSIRRHLRKIVWSEHDDLEQTMEIQCRSISDSPPRTPDFRVPLWQPHSPDFRVPLFGFSNQNPQRSVVSAGSLQQLVRVVDEQSNLRRAQRDNPDTDGSDDSDDVFDRYDINLVRTPSEPEDSPTETTETEMAEMQEARREGDPHAPMDEDVSPSTVEIPKQENSADDDKDSAKRRNSEKIAPHNDSNSSDEDLCFFDIGNDIPRGGQSGEISATFSPDPVAHPVVHPVDLPSTNDTDDGVLQCGFLERVFTVIRDDFGTLMDEDLRNVSSDSSTDENMTSNEQDNDRRETTENAGKSSDHNSDTRCGEGSGNTIASAERIVENLVGRDSRMNDGESNDRLASTHSSNIDHPLDDKNTTDERGNDKPAVSDDRINKRMDVASGSSSETSSDDEGSKKNRYFHRHKRQTQERPADERTESSGLQSRSAIDDDDNNGPRRYRRGVDNERINSGVSDSGSRESSGEEVFIENRHVQPQVRQGRKRLLYIPNRESQSPISVSPVSHSDEDDSDFELQCNELPERREKKYHAHKIRKGSLSVYMRSKIGQLPLPLPLRIYVNYNREL